MAIVEFMDFAIELSYFFFDVFIYIVTSLVSTGSFLYGFFGHLLNGIWAALDFVPNCTNNGITCGLKAFRIFFLELGKSFDIYDLHTSSWHVLVCLIVLFTPFLREIVLTCLTLSLTLLIAIFLKVFKVFTNNRRHRIAVSRSRLSRWTAAYLNRTSDRVKGVFKTTPTHQARRWTKNNTANSSNTQDSILTCIVCYEKPKCVLLMPCKHVCLCLDCSNNLMETRQKLCPLCRNHIKSAIKIHI